ncbi:MAG: glycosyl transferase [Azospira oryzae]|nr:MAG: glycosyl transferase [Azospira oryzae]
MKILVIRFSSIGDIVLTTPVVRCLKTQLDDAEIHYATKPNFKVLFEENPYIDKMHYLTGGIGEFIAGLRKENFDCIIDLHHNLRTTLIKTALGVKSYSFHKLNWKKWLLVHLKINQMPDVHIVDRYLETAKKLGVKNDSLGLDYFIPAKDVVPLNWLPETHRQGYVAYVVGAQHATKKLPLNRMIELCAKMNRPIVLLGGKEDASNGEHISSYFETKKSHEVQSNNGASNTIIYNACGKYNLNQSASLVKQARVVFAHDTGLMHVAAAFKKEVYSIWGNTVPAFGMYPYRTRYTSLENNHLSCRPCSKIGYKKCPKGHFKCMNENPFDFYLS